MKYQIENCGLADNYACKMMTETLRKADWGSVATIHTDVEDVYGYKFRDNKGAIYAFWWDYFDESGYQDGDTKAISFPVDFGGQALVTEGVPHIESGSGKDIDPERYEEFFNTQVIDISDSELTLELGKNPVFVKRLETHPDGGGCLINSLLLLLVG